MTRRKYPVSLEFKEGISITTIRQKQTPVHASIARSVSDDIDVHQLPKRFNIPGHFHLFEDAPIDTDPTTDLSHPDLQLLYRDPSAKLPKPVFAVEVGFSQSGRSLENRAKQLLQKTPASVVVIFDVKETPTYRNPFISDEGWRNDKIDLFKMRSSSSNMEDSLCRQYPRKIYSPILIYGLRWASEMIALVQVFMRDPINGGIVEKTDKIVSIDEKVCLMECYFTNIIFSNSMEAPS